MIHSDATFGRLQPRSAAATRVHTDGELPGSAPVRATATAVSALWAGAWNRLRAEYHNVDGRWPAIERLPAVARTLAAAGREAGRCQRGTGDLDELDRRLRVFEAAVLKAMAAEDQARSERLCLDCGGTDAETETVLPGLTSGRVCRRCLRGNV